MPPLDMTEGSESMAVLEGCITEPRSGVDGVFIFSVTDEFEEKKLAAICVVIPGLAWINTAKAFRLKEEVLSKMSNLPLSQKKILQDITSFLKTRKYFKSESVPGYKLEMLVLVVMLTSTLIDQNYSM